MSRNWLKLNPDNCTFGETSIKFYGNTISKDGIKPDPDKVDIILRIPISTSKTELSSFLGMCNYLSPYGSCLSDVTAPLRQLVKKTVEFTWNSIYEKLFKEAISFSGKYKLLQYFVQVNFIHVYTFLQGCSCVFPMGAKLYLKLSTYSIDPAKLLE